MWWIEAGRGSKSAHRAHHPRAGPADGGRRSDATFGRSGARNGRRDAARSNSAASGDRTSDACSAAGSGADPAELERSDDGNHLLHAGTGAACESDGLVGDAGRVDWVSPWAELG